MLFVEECARKSVHGYSSCMGGHLHGIRCTWNEAVTRVLCLETPWLQQHKGAAAQWRDLLLQVQWTSDQADARM